MPLMSMFEDAAPVGIEERAAAFAPPLGVLQNERHILSIVIARGSISEACLYHNKIFEATYGEAVAVTRVVEVDRVLVPVVDADLSNVSKRKSQHVVSSIPKLTRLLLKDLRCSTCGSAR